jgi:hypothetical protein
MFSFDDDSSLLVLTLGVPLKLANESHFYASLLILALAGPVQLDRARFHFTSL